MCVRTSTDFYVSFILDMDRSPSFGSAVTDSSPLKTWFPFGSETSSLNLASYGNFILDMGRSPGFGSTAADLTRI